MFASDVVQDGVTGGQRMIGSSGVAATDSDRL
jgi:hypothetical protein